MGNVRTMPDIILLQVSTLALFADSASGFNILLDLRAVLLFGRRAVIDRIPARALEDDSRQLGNAPYGAQMALRTASQRFIGEQLSSFEIDAATQAFIQINGHTTSSKI
jgi:hypothetical protein